MIAFDLDGTLVDSRADLWQAVNALRSIQKLPALPYEETWPDLCRGMPHLYRTCFPEVSGDITELRSEFESIYLARIFEDTQVFDGIADTLARLRQIVPLAVVTNKPQVATEALLSAANLTQYFDVIVGGDRCSAPKPSPIPLQFAYEMSRSTQPLVMVGDSNGDIRCGRSANARTIWCKWGYWPTVAEVPSFEAEAPSDIFQYLRSEGYNLS